MNYREVCRQDDGEKTWVWRNCCSTTDEQWPAVTDCLPCFSQYWLSSLCCILCKTPWTTTLPMWIKGFHPLPSTDPGSDAQYSIIMSKHTPVARSTLLYCNNRLQSLHIIMLYLWCFLIFHILNFLMNKHIILHLIVNMFHNCMPNKIFGLL